MSMMLNQEEQEKLQYQRAEQLKKLDIIRKSYEGGRRTIISLRITRRIKLCLYNYRTLVYFIVGFLLAYFKHSKLESYFSTLVSIELKLFFVYSLIYFCVCFTEADYVQYSQFKDHKDFDINEISLVLNCKQCLTGIDQKVRHCQDCGCCTIDYMHHCSFLGICVGKIKYYLFASMIVLLIFFTLVTYWELYKIISITISALRDMDLTALSQVDI